MKIINKTIATFFTRCLAVAGLLFSVDFIIKFFASIDYEIAANLAIENCVAMRIFTCFTAELILGIDFIVKFHVFEALTFYL
jgi:hypothetical protein